MSKLEIFAIQSPNGEKVVHFAELLKIPYKFHALDYFKGELKKPEFLKINSAGLSPAITYTEGDKSINLGESGAILQFLADKYDKEHKYLYTEEDPEYAQQLYWAYFAVLTLAPAMGRVYMDIVTKQSGSHVTAAKEKAIQIWETVEKHLAEVDYFAGSKLTFVDASFYPFVKKFEFYLGKLFDDVPSLKKWLDRVSPVFAAGDKAFEEAFQATS